LEKIYRSNIWMEKFKILGPKGDEDKREQEIRIFENVTDISHFVGDLADAAVVVGIKIICCLNDLMIVDTIFKQQVDEVQTTDSKIS
jgi:hypothetical protein